MIFAVAEEGQKGEPMDLIERHVALNAVDAIGHIATMPDGDKCIRRSAVKYTLSMLPSAQPEMKKGKWVKIPGMNEYCSACNQFFPLSYFQGRPFEINYCPNCGAKMEEKQYE